MSVPKICRSMEKMGFTPRNQRKSSATSDPIIRMCWNENQLGISPKAVAAMKEALEKSNLYPDFYAVALKDRIGEVYGLTRDNVFTAGGSSAVIDAIGAVYLDEGDEVLYCTPTFGAYRDMAVVNGAVPVEIPLTAEMRFDLDGLYAAITDQTKIIVICNPNNPTGMAVGAAELEDFVKKVPAHILIMIDEAYIEYADDPAVRSAVPLISEGYSVIVLKTFSKIHGMAGIRVGYGLAKEAIIDDLMRSPGAFNTSTVAIAGATASLGDRDFLSRSYQMVKEGRHYLIKEMEKLGCQVYHSQTSFLYFDAHMDPQKLKVECAKRGILIGAFELSRVSIGDSKQNAAFICALADILDQ
ncbi:MAG: histidinol-phosphate transaminase [Oscillospiraceae bacterium]|nr:histidinol-phosphate transaminase [Oscillospiraceae bacterium]